MVPLLALGPAAGAAADSVDFYTTLSGAEQTTPVTTDASGAAGFSWSADGTSLDYVVIVNKLVDATGAHIHSGAAGTDGPVLATLFGPHTGKDVDGILQRGTITESDLASGTMADLAQAMRNDMTYVNVHTVANPAGEIRGQINFPQPPCEGDFNCDGSVGFSDLNDVLANWGPCARCPEDLTGDNVVGFADLNIVLANWGDCP